MKPVDWDRVGGFWRRLCAGAFDLTFVTVIVASLSRLGVLLNVYLPVELTVLLAYPVYLIVSHCWKKQTVGKWLTGLFLVGIDGETVSHARIILRETVWKLLSFLPLGCGFFLCALSKNKRALHDYLSGSIVLKHPSPLGRWGRATVWVVMGAVVYISLDIPCLIDVAGDYAVMRPASPFVFPFERRESNQSIEASSVDEAQLNAHSQWICENAMDPIEYAVDKAQHHQALVFGEVHEKKEALEFLNELIPQLYGRAGVTRIAMEVCLAEDNSRLERLVTADVFDRDAALEIARRQPWGVWGFKEYWDVLETVWRLNQTIPAGQKKVTVIGLDSPMDMQSVGMLGLEDNPTKNCPIWEKLRVFRLPRILPKVLARDLRMARWIEREILERGERAIVWVGAQHAWASPQAVGEGGFRATRMGALLRRKHEDRAFFIRLHGFDIPISYVDRNYQGPDPSLCSLIEKIVQKSERSTAAFDTAASPLGRLRDSASFDYHYESRLCLQDISDGYIYLRAWDKFTQCDWLDGYVTQQMFVANKPFYQSFEKSAGKEIQTADDVNRFFKSGY